jgi:hypothetical protein
MLLLKNPLKNLIKFSAAGEPPHGQQLLEPRSFLIACPKNVV